MHSGEIGRTVHVDLMDEITEETVYIYRGNSYPNELAAEQAKAAYERRISGAAFHLFNVAYDLDLASALQFQLSYRKAVAFDVDTDDADKAAKVVAEEFAAGLGLTIEHHSADWKTDGKRAGYLRNAEMVALGADICLAYIKNGSRGATMPARMAEKAGITTIRRNA